MAACVNPMEGNDPPVLERIQVDAEGSGFVGADSATVLRPWGFNYDHDRDGRLLEDYWQDEWPTVIEDFKEMAVLGANVVRVHLQFARFMESPTRPRARALARLADLIELAETTGLYLDVTGLGCYHAADVPDWYDALAVAERWQAQACFWEAIAQACAGSTAVFCYDLMNEPILPGRGETADDWLAGAFAGSHFVQRICLDLEGRSRIEVARAWVQLLTDSIRRHDPDAMITVGVIPWAFHFPGAAPIFYDPSIRPLLDFVCVHVYPERGKAEEAAAILKRYEFGMPLVVEEVFPLRCDLDELTVFLDRTSDFRDGAISFYWGTTPDQLAEGKPSIGDAILRSWLLFFQQRAKLNAAAAGHGGVGSGGVGQGYAPIR